MIFESFNNLMGFLKSTTPVSIISNIVICVILVIIGVLLLRQKQEQTKAKKVGGWVCITISVLAFLGAIINIIFFYIIF